MKRSSKISSSNQKIAQWLNQYSLLILGFTCVSIVTTSIIGLGNQCYSGIDSSRNMVNNSSIRNISSPQTPFIWLYGAIILSLSATPWLLTHFLKQIAVSSSKKAQRLNTILSTPQTALKPALTIQKSNLVSTKSNLSYRIATRKATVKRETSMLHQSKNLTLPFDHKLQTKK
ncbi:hypothetical protein Sta7437_2370 [Stanieria cyanosphaera PCC 7437]|uniref:Uncharacterized protein n=1 Tax=Stanieria cyanosphaera (strain ATCC 29371 / PCC 7437) TaxID=111780 RepID=K9XV05_STAC7|nr:hypothetical protein [Stanieria cyanosphaera]AFZ35911.1 hypothetical protein Sta7437_2370 [Stanieria cyanosphaera PCC 7437]